MAAGPVITDIEEPPSKVSFFSKEVEVEMVKSVASDVVFKEKDESRASLFESLTRQSSLKAAAKFTTSGTEYAMSAPAADVLSPLAAFRREIERRVMEQLAGEKKPTTDLGVTSEDNEVLEPFQNLPLRERLLQRRETGAVKDEAQLADSCSGDIDAPEAQAQMLQDQSSLTDAQQQSEIVAEAENRLERARDAAQRPVSSGTAVGEC